MHLRFFIIGCTFPVLLAVLPLRADGPTFGNGIDRGTLEADEITEASGIAASHRTPGILWTHNDGGDQARLFALDTNGKHRGEIRLQGLTERDWEDMASGPGPEDGAQYLYVGDIGDNSEHHDLKYIYRIPEPSFPSDGTSIDTTIADFDTITFRYPDGSHDAETLMVDPVTRDIYIVSKKDSRCRIYRAPYPQSTTDTITLEHVGVLTFQGAVGGDISPDGREILVRTYAGVFYWARSPGENIADVLKAEPMKLPYIQEAQGEAVCWAFDGSGYFTLSEEPLGIPAHLYFYPRLSEASTVDEGMLLPPAYRFDRVYPNPARSSAVVEYSLARSERVLLALYDDSGRRVKNLEPTGGSVGRHSTMIDLGNLPSGRYHLRLRTEAGHSEKAHTVVVVER